MLSLKKQNHILSKLTVANRRKEIFDMIKNDKININDLIIKNGHVVRRPVPVVTEKKIDTFSLPDEARDVPSVHTESINVTPKVRGPRKPYGPRKQPTVKQVSTMRPRGWYTEQMRFTRVRDTRYIKGNIFTVAAWTRTASRHLGMEFKCEDCWAWMVGVTRTK